MTEPTEQEHHPERDWFAILVPLAFSLAIQLGAGLYVFGGINSRVANLEDRQKIIDATRVTQDDLKAQNAQLTIEKQELSIRLNRMDDKLDRLVELLMGRGSSTAREH